MHILSDTVKIGDKIEIKQLDQKGVPINSAKTYVSQVLDFIEDKKIIIATPIKTGMVVILNKGENYRLGFYTLKGLYQCNCTMIQTYRENNMIVALVSVISKLEKLQRRQYYRLECVHEIEYRRISKEEMKLEEKLINKMFESQEEKSEIRKKHAKFNQEWLRGSIIDLSGGGCRFTSEQELAQGDKVRIRLEFLIKNELKNLVVNSDIIVSQKIINRLGFYEHRAEFSHINDNDREDLIKYIFEQERKLKRNEKR